LRLLFESNSDQNTIKFSTGLGISDRTGDRYLVFDIDGTVCAVRQRDLSDTQQYPQARRRSEAASAPGYRGRKRGEAVRTRTTICHAQTGEWLGTYGGAGNGEVKEDLERSLQRISSYLKAQNLKVVHGILRLDGLYGTPQMASLVQKNGLGYVMRCRDYHLLEHLDVQARMNPHSAG
jgi:RecB family endonuclease NucS